MRKRSFKQDLEKIDSFQGLSDFVLELDRKMGNRNKSLLCNKAMELMTDRVDELEIFCKNCYFEHLNFKLVRLFVDRHGIIDFAAAVSACKILFAINVNKYQSSSKSFCNRLLTACVNMSVSSDDIDDERFMVLVSSVNDISEKKIYFPPKIYYPKLRLFVNCMTNRIVERIRKGSPKEKFLVRIDNVYFRCDLMVAIAQMQDVSIGTLADLLDDRVFHCPTGVIKEVHSAYVALLHRAMEVLERGEYAKCTKKEDFVKRKIKESIGARGALAVLTKNGKIAASQQ